MIEKKVVIQNETGFHARPASVFVREASQVKSEVTIIAKGEEYNAKSLIGLLSIGATKGTELILRLEGEDEAEKIEALAEIILTMD